MKKLLSYLSTHRLYCVIVIALLMPMSATATWNLTNRDKSIFMTINYNSIDADNRPVVLSAAVLYPYEKTEDNPKAPKKIKYILLNHHPTISSNAEAPTGNAPLDGGQTGVFSHGFVATMTTDDALVISPDYLGYGVSSDRVHPYCNAMLTARNEIDAFFAAIDSVKARGVEFDDDWYTINVGFSQGGAVAMAVQKYLEVYASKEQRDAFRLKQTICGDGPYNLLDVYDNMASQQALACPHIIPILIDGIYASYNEGSLKTFGLPDFYASEEICSKFTEYTRRKELTYEIFCDSITKYLGTKTVALSDVVNHDVFNEKSTLSRAMHKVLAKENLTDGSWIPQTPITLYHGTEDDIVPFACAESAAEAFGDKVKLIKDDELSPNISDIALKGLLQTTSLVNIKHMKYAVYFYVYLLSGQLFDNQE